MMHRCDDEVRHYLQEIRNNIKYLKPSLEEGQSKKSNVWARELRAFPFGGFPIRVAKSVGRSGAAPCRTNSRGAGARHSIERRTLG
jgi:hypothetical protein